MRLLYVQSSSAAYAANASRYQDAIDLAVLHVGSLRSTLGGFASTIDPGVYFSLLPQGTIMGDIDNELASYYFALDQRLLDSLIGQQDISSKLSFS